MLVNNSVIFWKFLFIHLSNLCTQHGAQTHDPRIKGSMLSDWGNPTMQFLNSHFIRIVKFSPFWTLNFHHHCAFRSQIARIIIYFPSHRSRQAECLIREFYHKHIAIFPWNFWNGMNRLRAKRNTFRCFLFYLLWSYTGYVSHYINFMMHLTIKITSYNSRKNLKLLFMMIVLKDDISPNKNCNLKRLKSLWDYPWLLEINPSHPSPLNSCLS